MLLGYILLFWALPTEKVELAQQHFIGATLASLITLILHGFIDNAIYSNAGSTMLFIAPALAFSLTKSQTSAGIIKKANLAALL